MVQAHLPGRADVHRRTQAHGFKSAEHFDRFRVVLVAALGRASHVFFVAHLFSWPCNFSRVPAALDRLRAIRGAGPRSKNSFSVKQGRRICGMLLASPHPLIPDSPGKSRTRRVPAPSHLAQRDVAKTHVSPGPCPPSSWREARFLGSLLPGGRVDFADANHRIDNPQIVLDPVRFLNRKSNPATEISAVFT